MESIWMNKALSLTLVLTRCFVVYHAQACGTTEYSNSVGYVSSPMFPNLYAHRLNCSYNLRSSGPTSLTIIFQEIDLEAGDTTCQYDWVEISCSQNYERIQKFCRLGETRSVFYASCNHAIITFRTDYSNSGKGFQIYYSFQRAEDDAYFCSLGSLYTKFFCASTTTILPTTTTRITTLSPTTETSTVSIIVTEDPDATDILSYIARALSPKTSALLILVLGGLLGLSLLFIVALLIILKCRSRKSKAGKGKKTRRQELPSQSTEHYTLDPTEERGERKNETGRVDNARESCIIENDYELPDDDDYVNAGDELPDDDYENADEINTVTIGRR